MTDITAARRELEASRDAFLGAVHALTEAQWRFRADDASWSIAEIAEHVALVSRDVGRMVRGPLLRTDRVDDAPGDTESRIRRFLPDRSRRVSAPPSFVPVGTWTDRDELTRAYASTRDELLAWLRETDAPLRAHRLPHPRMGPMDGIEWLVFLAAHDQRHVLQIGELKGAEQYPA